MCGFVYYDNFNFIVHVYLINNLSLVIKSTGYIESTITLNAERIAQTNKRIHVSHTRTHIYTHINTQTYTYA